MSRRFDVEVSLALGADISADPSTWVWTVITPYCMVRDGGVTIGRGRQNWQLSVAQPAQCDLLVNNADGRFSRLNPAGAWYGQLTKNTPLRVRARAVGGSYTTRFVGFISDFPPRWDVSESHFWVPLQAQGVLRRLGLRTKQSRSLARSVADYWQTYFSPSFIYIPESVGYWPLEEEGGTQASSGLVGGGEPLIAVGTVTFGTGSPPPGASTAPSISGGSLRGAPKVSTKPFDPATAMWRVSCYFKATADCRVLSWDFGTGAAALAISSGELVLITSDILLATFTGSPTTQYTDGQWHSVQVRGFLSSGTTLFTGEADDTNETMSLVSTIVPGPVLSVHANPLSEAGLASISHILVLGSGISDTPLTYAVMRGTPGETTFDNFRTIGQYNDLAYTTLPSVSAVLSDPSLDGVPMGVFPSGTLPQMLAACVEAESGRLVDRLTGELGLDLRTGMENLTVGLALDYAQNQIHPPFEPTDDDQIIRNDVMVTRTDGGSARVERTDGPLGSDPTTGAGRYDEALTRNLYELRQAYDHAGWRVNLGTVNEYRYPPVVLKFHRASSLLAAWLTSDVGTRVTIDNLPANMPQDLVDQIIEGYTERINDYEWSVVLNLSPYKPYKVFELSDDAGDTSEFVGRIAGDAAAAIRGAITSSATSIAFDPNRYRWATLMLKDTATRTVAAGSWGTPDIGTAWTIDEGTASYLSVNGSVLVMSHATIANLSQKVDVGTPDQDMTIYFRIPVAPTGGTAAAIALIRPRWTDANNFYDVRATTDAAGVMAFVVRVRVGGVTTVLATGTSLSLNITHTYGLRVMARGTDLRAKFWDSTAGAEPDWQIVLVEPTLTTGNTVLILTIPSNVTNVLPFAFWIDNVAVVGPGSNVDDFPLNARLGGEVVTASAITTTPVTYVAATAHVHADNAAVTPTISGSAVANDLMVILGAIRSSGVGTLVTPTGYTRLPVFATTDNVQLFAKVHSGSESNPTVTPSGGSAGDTVSAQMAVLRGTPTSLTNLADIVVDSRTLLNGSAQNVAYPGLYPQVEGCFVLAVMWKQDDHTGVAQLIGFTEIDDPTTVIGNDQSMAWDYQIQTSPAVVNEGSFVVSGGASAISRSAVVAFAAGYQTATVTRNVNGIVGGKAQTASTKIEVEDALVLGL